MFTKITSGFIGSLMLIGLVTPLAASAKENETTHDNNGKNSFVKTVQNVFAPKEVSPQLEVHINQNGNVTIHGAKVTAVTGSVITATTAWGNSATTWTIVTDSATSVTRQKGGKSSVSEITVGDLVSVTGMLDQSASAFTVKAKSVRDYSIVQTESNLEGSIGSVNTAQSSFVLKTEKLGDITVRVGSTTVLMKNSATTTLTDLTVGLEVKTNGIYNSTNKTLDAKKVTVVIRSGVVSGVIQSIASTTIPTSITFTDNGKTYVANLISGASILNSFWQPVPLSAFKIGDHIRVFGTILGTTITASVARDSDLK